MNRKKGIILGFLILLLLTVTILSSCGGKDMRPEKALNNFSKIIGKQSLEEFSLTIYYMSPFTLTLFPYSVDDLIDYCDGKVVISGMSLQAHADLLKQINNVVLIPVENDVHLNARLYYVFKDRNNHKIFDFVRQGENFSIFINGFAFKENLIFYDIVIPFLPKEIAEEYEAYVNGRIEVSHSGS